MNNNLFNIDVSKLAEDQKDIVECIGIESYYKLTQYYGGSQIYIARPTAIDKQKRNKMIIEEFNKGVGYRQLAIKYNLTETWVRMIVAENINNKSK